MAQVPITALAVMVAFRVCQVERLQLLLLMVAVAVARLMPLVEHLALAVAAEIALVQQELRVHLAKETPEDLTVAGQSLAAAAALAVLVQITVLVGLELPHPLQGRKFIMELVVVALAVALVMV